MLYTPRVHNIMYDSYSYIACVHVHVRTFLSMTACTIMYTFLRHTYIHSYIHVHAHTHTHMHTHTKFVTVYIRENQAFVKNINFRVFTSCSFRIVYHRYTIVANLKSIPCSSPEIYKVLLLYLGVWFTKKNRFTKEKKHLDDKAKKAMFSLLSTIARLHHPPIPIILQLYESMLNMDVRFWDLQRTQI